MLEKTVSNEIINIVKEEIRVYREILLLSNEKRQILVEGKATELDRIVRIEQKLSTEVVKLEQERDRLLQEAVEAGDIDKEDIIVSKLIKKMDEAAGKSINDASTELMGLLEAIKEINDINGELIKQSLDYIEYTVNIMSSTTQATNLTYGSDSVDGKKAGSKKTFFDSKI